MSSVRNITAFSVTTIARSRCAESSKSKWPEDAALRTRRGLAHSVGSDLDHFLVQTYQRASDVARILTISDIFSALIEQRTYKHAMPRATAYEVLLGMKGKLERPLVEAFRDVALNR